MQWEYLHCLIWKPITASEAGGLLDCKVTLKHASLHHSWKPNCQLHYLMAETHLSWLWLQHVRLHILKRVPCFRHPQSTPQTGQTQLKWVIAVSHHYTPPKPYFHAWLKAHGWQYVYSYVTLTYKSLCLHLVPLQYSWWLSWTGEYMHCYSCPANISSHAFDLTTAYHRKGSLSSLQALILQVHQHGAQSRAALFKAVICRNQIRHSTSFFAVRARLQIGKHAWQGTSVPCQTNLLYKI